MPRRDVVVVGASAGGVEALRDLVSQLPASLPATVLVVLHVPPTGTSALPAILARAGALPVRHATDMEELRPGTVLIAPPDRHLMVHDGRVMLTRGPTENGHRPAVDVLFRSAARAYGSRVVGVVLSGALDDGAAGMVAVKLQGGVGLAQDPAEALHPSMPKAAAAAVGLDLVLPVKEIAASLVELTEQEVDDPPNDSDLTAMEADMAEMDLDALTDPSRPGEPSGWTCPDCQGALFEIDEGGFLRFRCRVGHAWSADSLMAQQASMFETALWTALRTLEEKVALTLDLGRRAKRHGHTLTGEQFERQAEESQRSAAVLRALIDNIAGTTDDEPRVARTT